MPQITQFLSRTIQQAPQLFRPQNVLGPYLAEAVQSGVNAVQQYRENKQKKAAELAEKKDEYAQAKQKIADEGERATKQTEIYQGLGKIDDSLKGVTNNEEYETFAKKGLIDLKNQIYSTTGSPVVRQELINDLNPRFERLFIEKYKPEADRLLFNKTITAKTEEIQINSRMAVLKQGTMEGDEAGNKVILGWADMRDLGLIKPQEALEGQMKFLRERDLYKVQKDLEDDPASVASLSENDLLGKYSNLTTKDYIAVISTQNKKIEAFLEKEEKDTKDVLLSILREKATNKQVSHRELDKIRNAGRLKAEEYSDVRKILDTNLKTYEDVLAEQITGSLEVIGEQNKVKIQSTVFEAIREFELRAKRLDTITEEGNEYAELMQDMLEKYTPVPFGGELIYITPYPEGTFKPGEAQTTTTPTTTGKKKEQTTTDKTSKGKEQILSSSIIWTKEQIISALKAGEITIEEASIKADELLTGKNQNATRE